MFNLDSMYNKHERRGHIIWNNFQKDFYGAEQLLQTSMKAVGMRMAEARPLQMSWQEEVWIRNVVLHRRHRYRKNFIPITRRLIFIITGKRILLFLQRWDLRYIVFLFLGPECSQMGMRKLQMRKALSSTTMWSTNWENITLSRW